MLTPTPNYKLEDLGRQEQRVLDDCDLAQLLSVVKARIKAKLIDKVDSIHFQEDPLFNFRGGFRFSVMKWGRCFVSPVVDFYINSITTDVKKVNKSGVAEFFGGVEYVYDCSGYIENIIDMHVEEVERVIDKFKNGE